MSPDKRIFLNIVATYGRSLYCVECGLFTRVNEVNGVRYAEQNSAELNE